MPTLLQEETRGKSFVPKTQGAFFDKCFEFMRVLLKPNFKLLNWVNTAVFMVPVLSHQDLGSYWVLMISYIRVQDQAGTYLLVSSFDTTCVFRNFLCAWLVTEKVWDFTTEQTNCRRVIFRSRSLWLLHIRGKGAPGVLTPGSMLQWEELFLAPKLFCQVLESVINSLGPPVIVLSHPFDY